MHQEKRRDQHGEWYTPIRLIPDNGRVLTGYLVGLHMAACLVLISVVPVPIAILLAMVMAFVLRHDLKGIASGSRVSWVVIRHGGQIALADRRHQTRVARLVAFRVIGGLAVLRARTEGGSIRFCFRRGHQDAGQWHRLILMRRYGGMVAREGESG